MDSGRLTSVKLRKGPLAADKAAVGLLLLLLAQGEVNFVLAGGDAFAGELEVLSVAVALVLTVHEDKDCEAWGDVTLRLHVHAERYGEVGDGDEAFDVPIAVPRPVLLQPRTTAPQLYEAGDLFEGRHDREWRNKARRCAIAAAVGSSSTCYSSNVRGKRQRTRWKGEGYSDLVVFGMILEGRSCSLSIFKTQDKVDQDIPSRADRSLAAPKMVSPVAPSLFDVVVGGTLDTSGGDTRAEKRLFVSE